jgi:hypothetical protein|tara:strand:- start:428 stop:811 length:384 start_codon:yes stop_codon:yes gene_type:complete
LERILYSDGDLRKISWIIQTSQTVISQNRKHTENYKDKITKIQSKYVALHVALFWGIGTFNIKNEDSIKIKLDEEIMYQQLKMKIPIQDEFIKNKIKFIENFIKQRKLKVEFEIINFEKNLASKILQ